MANHESQHEFHDELLSAYLDGELTGEELARVEERLAVDPVARQTLAELRSVSQALRGLPSQRVGEDLRGVILAQVEEAKQGRDSALVVAATLGANGREKVRLLMNQSVSEFVGAEFLDWPHATGLDMGGGGGGGGAADHVRATRGRARQRAQQVAVRDLAENERTPEGGRGQKVGRDQPG